MFTSKLVLIVIFGCLLCKNLQGLPCYDDNISLYNQTLRYQSLDIHAINEKADKIEIIKVWVDTPTCIPWIFRGCIYDKHPIGQRSIQTHDGFRGWDTGCYETIYEYHKRRVYDRWIHVDKNAPAMTQLTWWCT